MKTQAYCRLAGVTGLVSALAAQLWGGPTCSLPPNGCTPDHYIGDPMPYCCRDLSFAACKNVIKQWTACTNGAHAWTYWENNSALQPCDDEVKKCGSWP